MLAETVMRGWQDRTPANRRESDLRIYARDAIEIAAERSADGIPDSANSCNLWSTARMTNEAQVDRESRIRLWRLTKPKTARNLQLD